MMNDNDTTTASPPPIKSLPSRRLSNSSVSTRQQRRKQALQDAAGVRWEDRNNFNLCSVVITHHRHVRSASFGNSVSAISADVSGSGLAPMASGSGSSSFYFDPAYYLGASSTTAQEFASSLYEVYDTMVNLQEDYEHGVDWNEMPYLQREEAPAYLLNLDMTGVEAHVKRASAGTAADDFSSMNHILNEISPLGGRKQLLSQSTSDYWEDTVPGLFFLEDFDLTDPYVFEQVLEVVENFNEELTPRSAGKSHSQEFQSQQDVLTQILDTVESALLVQVKTRSMDFFRESKRFQTLKDMVNDGHTEVTGLRELLKKLNMLSTTQLKPIPREATERENLKELENTLISISDVIDSKSSIGGLIAANDFMGAIEMIGRSRYLLLNGSLFKDGSSSNDEVNLSSVRCLSTVQTQLGEYEKLIVGDLSNRLINSFLSWEEADDSSTDASVLALRRPKENEIIRLAQVLSSCGELYTVGELYAARLKEIMRETIETIVNECVNDASYATETKSMKDSTSLTFEQFMECLDLLFSEILGRLRNAAEVNRFLKLSSIDLMKQKSSIEEDNLPNSERSQNKDNGIPSVTEIAHKSISDLLRQRKELHSLVSLDEMKQLWDACLSFTLQLESFTGSKVYGLRSTLLAQAKSFVERKHENHMAALVAALDGEKWIQVSVSQERQLSITYLSTGRAAIPRSKGSQSHIANMTNETSPIRNTFSGRRELNEAEVEGSKYKLVWSCLVLVEMIMTNIACAAHFQTLASNIVGKVTELMRLFNSRTTQLVLGAGALHSSAKLKSINAKHLALVTQCLGMLTAILPHIRAALMAQLPTKQHKLLTDLDRVKKDYAEHTEKCLAKFVSIVGSIVERALAPSIASTDFDKRAASNNNMISCCSFLDGIVSNTRKMYQVLKTLLPRHDLQDVYSRIFAYVDQKVPSLFIAAASGKNISPKKAANGSTSGNAQFSMPKTFEGKMQMIKEVELMTEQLQLDDLISWKFSAPNTLKHHLGINLGTKIQNNDSTGQSDNQGNGTSLLEATANKADENPPISDGSMGNNSTLNDSDGENDSELLENVKDPENVEAEQSKEIKNDENIVVETPLINEKN